MRSLRYKKYCFIAAFLFLIVILPTLFIESFRGKVVALFSPAWGGASRLAHQPKSREEYRLEGENHLLRVELEKCYALLQQQKTSITQAIPAQVIYRDPGSWTSSLWIDVGEETNQKLGRCVVEKNSPVINGRAIVGAIDYVGRRQSRVRLITDVALKPAVRAVRGNKQNRVLVEHIDPLLRHLNGRSDLPHSAKEMVEPLKALKQHLLADGENWYLAKGFLQGAGTPLWKSINHTLRGVGFNYDFSDEKGPARELISGKPVDPSSQLSALPLIKVNDLLVTTGMDGLFPPGLRVAEVTKVYPLREGAYTFDIEASPCAGMLEALQTVFVIPALGYDATDQPS